MQEYHAHVSQIHDDGSVEELEAQTLPGKWELFQFLDRHLSPGRAYDVTIEIPGPPRPITIRDLATPEEIAEMEATGGIAEDAPDEDENPERDERIYTKAIARAERLGYDHGTNHALAWLEWSSERVHREAAAILRGIEERNEVCLPDANLPDADLSGEMADTFTSRDLVDECAAAAGIGIDRLQRNYPLTVDDCDEKYRDTFRIAVLQKVEAFCREALGDPMTDDAEEIVNAASAEIRASDIEALFEIIPGAKDALQGIDVHNTKDMWFAAVMALDEPFTRSQVRDRVANAIRCLNYGERLDGPWGTPGWTPKQTRLALDAMEYAVSQSGDPEWCRDVQDLIDETSRRINDR